MDTPNTGGAQQGPRKPFKDLEEQLREAAVRVEDEVRRVVRYVDDEVVPEVRRNGSKALRIASDRLRRLAEQMEERSATPPPKPPASEPPQR